MSAIGDVGVAISEMSSRPRAVSIGALWIGVLAFFAVACLAGQLHPLLAPLCAALAFWSRQRWRKRAADLGARLVTREKALASLGHEAANAANAIRANLISLRLAGAPVSGSPHLEEIDRAAVKIDSVLRRTSLG